MEEQRPLKIGELSALAGVSTYTIRFYERTGILPPAPRTGARTAGRRAVKSIAWLLV